MNTPDPVNISPESLANFASHVQQFTQAFGAVPNNRTYAMDEISQRGGVALARAIWRTIKAADAKDDNSLGKLLKEVAPLVSTAVQSWRPAAEPPLPKLWEDPWGRVLPSPWDKDRPDPNGQAVLLQRDPALAEHLMKLAAAPFAFVAALRDDRDRRNFLRKLEFKVSDFDSNPFRRDINQPGVMEAQNAFVSNHSQAVVEVWRQEAEPVRWPWGGDGNLTELGRCVNELRGESLLDGNVLLLARKIDSDLLDAQRNEASAAQAAAAKRTRELHVTSS